MAMNTHRRNMLVGLTVLIALGLIAAMIIIFAGLPEQFRGGYRVTVTADSTHDVQPGDAVYLRGMKVGYVTSVDFIDPANPLAGVKFVLYVNDDVRLPGNSRVYFFTKGLVGTAYVAIKAEGPPEIDPQTGRELAWLPRDGSATIPSVHDPGSGSLIPPELQQTLGKLGDGIDEFSKLAKTLNELIAPAEGTSATQDGTGTLTTTTAPADPDGPGKPANLRETLARLDRTLSAMETILGDPENQQNLKASLANLAQASKQASDAMKAVIAFAKEAELAARDARTVTTQATATLESVRTAADTADTEMKRLSAQFVTDAEKAAELLATINRAASKLESGEGTAGKLLNDPKLYNSLLETSQQLTKLMKQLREIADQWKEQGVPLKLK